VTVASLGGVGWGGGGRLTGQCTRKEAVRSPCIEVGAPQQIAQRGSINVEAIEVHSLHIDVRQSHFVHIPIDSDCCRPGHISEALQKGLGFLKEAMATRGAHNVKAAETLAF